MAHYAFLDADNVVTEVIVGRDENEVVGEITDWEAYYSDYRGQRCVRTSYNAATNGFRKNYAGIGYTYSDDLDAFIPPKPYASWVLDEETCNWVAPIPYPDGNLIYAWNEEVGDWEATQFSIEL